MKYSILSLFLLLCSVCSAQHNHNHSHAHEPLHYPNISGYETLITDLHQHTVFSDGNVWPTIRVQEALRDSIDVISLTEHIEYQPHIEDIPHPNRNRAFDIAKNFAKSQDILVINGSEITRGKPMGHSNAIFLTDANQLIQDDAKQAFAEANKQGAFVFWNHPAWHAQSPTGNPILSDFQKDLIAKKQLHGIEVINTGDYAEESFALALKHNLTIMSTSDIHDLIEWDYKHKGNHRPVTLVFAKERTEEAMKEALFEGRTVAIFNSLLVGREEYLVPLLKESISIEKAEYWENYQILNLTIKNNSSSELILENAMEYNFYSSSPVFTLQPNEVKTLKIKTITKKENITLKLRALGAYTQPKIHPIVNWQIDLKK